jgi:hypothetical protein
MGMFESRGVCDAARGNHTFRATGITAYLGNGGTLEHVPRDTISPARVSAIVHSGAFSRHEFSVDYAISMFGFDFRQGTGTEALNQGMAMLAILFDGKV